MTHKTKGSPLSALSLSLSLSLSLALINTGGFWEIKKDCNEKAGPGASGEAAWPPYAGADVVGEIYILRVN